MDREAPSFIDLTSAADMPIYGPMELEIFNIVCDAKKCKV